MARAHRAVLGLGANLGDAYATLQSAVDQLAADDRTAVVAVSKVYRSAPIGGPEQPDYLNAAVMVTTDRRSWELLELAQAIEHDHDRVRAERWGPRTLDLDVIVFDEVVSNDPDLTLPHPRAHERLFVLLPWLEIAPGGEHPTQGALAALVVAAHDQDVEATDRILTMPQQDQS
jgi:2-amino-4-hydroxy-6-hydroxymethyldihydropteridine diphosphokinase